MSSDSLTFERYQSEAATTAIYPGQGSVMGLAYVGLGLGEAGEIQGKIKKILRDSNGILTEEVRFALAKEAGDLMWYLAQLAFEIQVPLDQIALENLAKLADRKERGVLTGSGDNR